MSRHADLYFYPLNHPKLHKNLPEGMPYKYTKKPYICDTNIHKRALHMRTSALYIMLYICMIILIYIDTRLRICTSCKYICMIHMYICIMYICMMYRCIDISILIPDCGFSAREHAPTSTKEPYVCIHKRALHIRERALYIIQISVLLPDCAFSEFLREGMPHHSNQSAKRPVYLIYMYIF